MLHHISIAVSNLDRSARVYDATLGALGYRRVWSVPDAIGYGFMLGKDKFAIKLSDDVNVPGRGFHVAFAARSRQAVERFHFAALEFGGVSNGEPGLRPQYGPRYFAAFVIDPDGHRIEAVINS